MINVETLLTLTPIRGQFERFSNSFYILTKFDSYVKPCKFKMEITWLNPLTSNQLDA